MSVSVIIDLVIAGVLAVCLYLGWRRGLFRSMTELAAAVLALVLAGQIAGFAANFLVDRAIRPAAERAIVQRVDEILSDTPERDASPREALEGLVDAIPSDFIRRQAEKVLAGLELSGESDLGRSARERLLELAGQVLDSVLQSVVYGLLHTLLYAASFFLLNGIFRLVIRALDLTFELPILRQVNQLGGLLFGGGKGLLLVYIGVWFLSHTGLLLTEEIIADSTLLRLAAAWVGVGSGATIL